LHAAPGSGRPAGLMGDIGSSTTVMDRFLSVRKPVSILDRFRPRSCAPSRSPHQHHCVDGWHPHRTGRKKAFNYLAQATRSRANENARVGSTSPASEPRSDVPVCHDRFSVVVGEGLLEERLEDRFGGGSVPEQTGPPPPKARGAADALDHLLLVDQGDHDCPHLAWLDNPWQRG
jgi:hypothetical protein